MLDISESCLQYKGMLSPAHYDAWLRDSRAGVPLHTQQFEETVKAVLTCSTTSLYGFYVHAGNSVSPLQKSSIDHAMP